MNSHKNFSDEQLYALCTQYGQNALSWRRKFAGLLPEVERRRLYFKKGFSSIFEFAAKLAGMSQEQVRRVLSIDEKFENVPVLKSLLEHGEVSVNKLARVASIATEENQEFWAEQVKILPQDALETLVRDEKNYVTSSPTLQNKNFTENLVRAHKTQPEGLKLSVEVEKKLSELQEKGIDINALLLKFLEKRDLEIAQEKEQLSIEIKPMQSRYIPAKIRTLLKKEHGEKCSIPTCNKLAETIHHTQRFSLSKTHDPRFLAPLCKNHHVIAHSIDMKFHLERAKARAGP